MKYTLNIVLIMLLFFFVFFIIGISIYGSIKINENLQKKNNFNEEQFKKNFFDNYNGRKL